MYESYALLFSARAGEPDANAHQTATPQPAHPGNVGPTSPPLRLAALEWRPPEAQPKPLLSLNLPRWRGERFQSNGRGRVFPEGGGGGGRGIERRRGAGVQPPEPASAAEEHAAEGEERMPASQFRQRCKYLTSGIGITSGFPV